MKCWNYKRLHHTLIIIHNTYIISMFSRYFQRQDKLTIDSLEQMHYTKVSEFDQFVANVELELKQVPMEPIKKIIEKFPVQWVRPIKKLCLRFTNQLKVINNLHHLFLQEAIKRNCLTEVLQVVDCVGIPFKMEPASIADYLFFCFEIYFKLGYYEKAYKKLQDILNKKRLMTKKAQKYVYPYLLMSRLYRNPNFSQEEIFSTLNLGHSIDDLIIPNAMATQIKQITQILMSYARRQKFNEEIMKQIFATDKTKLWQEIYQFTKQDTNILKQEVEQFKSDRLERVRLTDIKGRNLSQPQTMQQVNKLRNTAKYDCKQRILYINHEKASNDEINDLISRCYQLGECIKEASTIREVQIGLGRLGGLGGRGGFADLLGGIGGGMGGMRGFGGLGDMGF